MNVPFPKVEAGILAASGEAPKRARRMVARRGALLVDAMKGDTTLFAREDAVEAEWRIVVPIRTSTTPPHVYQPGTWGPVEAERLIDGPGGWAKPFATRTEP